MNSVLYTVHITVAASSERDATFQAIKYEPLTCDCELTKRNQVWGAARRFGLKAQAIYFYYEEENEEETNVMRGALAKNLSCA